MHVLQSCYFVSQLNNLENVRLNYLVSQSSKWLTSHTISYAEAVVEYVSEKIRSGYVSNVDAIHAYLLLNDVQQSLNSIAATATTENAVEHSVSLTQFCKENGYDTVNISQDLMHRSLTSAVEELEVQIDSSTNNVETAKAKTSQITKLMTNVAPAMETMFLKSVSSLTGKKDTLSDIALTGWSALYGRSNIEIAQSKLDIAKSILLSSGLDESVVFYAILSLKDATKDLQQYSSVDKIVTSIQDFFSQANSLVKSMESNVSVSPV